MLQRFKSTNKILKLNSNHNILADPVEKTLTPGEFKNPLVFWKLLVTSRIHVKLAQALYRVKGRRICKVVKDQQ